MGQVGEAGERDWGSLPAGVSRAKRSKRTRTRSLDGWTSTCKGPEAGKSSSRKVLGGKRGEVKGLGTVTSAGAKRLGLLSEPQAGVTTGARDPDKQARGSRASLSACGRTSSDPTGKKGSALPREDAPRFTAANRRLSKESACASAHAPCSLHAQPRAPSHRPSEVPRERPPPRGPLRTRVAPHNPKRGTQHPRVT